MIAPSLPSRKTRGRGLPGCGRGVTVPISAKPSPMASTAPTTRASLSKPAAMPSGLGNVRPHTFTASRPSSGTELRG